MSDTCHGPICQREITDRSPSRDFCSDTCANAYWHAQQKRYAEGRAARVALARPVAAEEPEPFPDMALFEPRPGFLWRALQRLGLVER